MRAWRVHDVGEPEDVLVVEDVEAPTSDGLAGMGMSMGGWVPIDEALSKVTPDFAILDMRAAALSASRHSRRVCSSSRRSSRSSTRQA